MKTSKDFEKIKNKKKERKLKTRASLIQAALDLMEDGRSFTGLSLREITREAGVVPTSFYRHFQDVDELGLAIVDEVGIHLRKLLREARREGVPFRVMIKVTLDVFIRYIKENLSVFRFVVRERMGGSERIRSAIRNEMNFFASELVSDLQSFGTYPKLSLSDLQVYCGLVVSTMFTIAGEYLDIYKEGYKAEKSFKETTVRQLRFIFLGALSWRQGKPKK